MVLQFKFMKMAVLGMPRLLILVLCFNTPFVHTFNDFQSSLIYPRTIFIGSRSIKSFAVKNSIKSPLTTKETDKTLEKKSSKPLLMTLKKVSSHAVSVGMFGSAQWFFSQKGFSLFPRVTLPVSFNSIKALTGPLALPILFWVSLFVFNAGLHASDVSFTHLYPWKVREFADTEGPTSSFAYVNRYMNRVLTTILIISTFSQVVSTVLFTRIVSQQRLFSVSEATVMLTVFTLLFGELLPKALGVSKAETVARSSVSLVTALSKLCTPLSAICERLVNTILRSLGVSQKEDKVSEEELRLIVMGAKQSGGIHSTEASMVQGALDLVDMKVSSVMMPRINVVALEMKATLFEFLKLVDETKYSRVPIYCRDIDRIVGVAIAKETLMHAMKPELHNTTTMDVFMEPTYFVPQSMSVQDVLQEMRRRRLHMAIVVDEHGGTAGVVTLEDILEEVVGEIYDEGDDEDQGEVIKCIKKLEFGKYEMRGETQLEEAFSTLQIPLLEEYREFGTLSGLLCDIAGEIPSVGHVLFVENYSFTVVETDERRILTARAERVDSPDELHEKMATSKTSMYPKFLQELSLAAPTTKTPPET